MARHAKQKSAHLQELEEVFERRTRRFSPFEVLGLRTEHDVQPHTDEGEKRDPEVGLNNPLMGGSNPPLSGSLRSTPEMGLVDPGMGKPIPGTGRPSRVVVFNEEPNTTTERPIPGMDLPSPSVGGSDTPISGLKRPTHGSQEIEASRLADLVAATQLGSRLGVKARQILSYLNSIRSIEHDSYTVPVGYGQISMAAGVDPDYLRRKVLPKLAMLGLIGVARKSLEGTVYHLPYSTDYLRVVAGEPIEEGRALGATSKDSDLGEHTAAWPDWFDRQQWGWLAPESIRRLVEKAGSEMQAREKLEIIAYNETHGSSSQRVRNRRSVLAHYLSSPQADLWPNDDGFETLAMRQARLERDRAQREKALMEEAFKARQETQKAQFQSFLSKGQFQWIKQEAKRRVDARPDSKFLTSRYPLYKAEEDQLLEEWMDRVGYGETVPSATAELT
jgi:hypothetical protein